MSTAPLRSVIVPLALLTACKETHTPSAILTELDGTEAVSIQLDDAVGDGVVRVPIRQVNSYGVGVPGGWARLAIRGGDASFQKDTVAFDAHGYASAKVTVPDGGVFEIQVQEAERTEAFGRPATGYSITRDLPAHGLSVTALLSSDVADPNRVVAGSSGVAVASEDEIWWVPASPGAVPHQVADLPFAISGMWSAHVDGDGIADLAVWADSQVILLRGREAGGYGWGGAWSAGDHDISGVAAGDVDGDRLADLVIASSTDDSSVVEILMGDGAWGFDALNPLELSYPVESVTASDDGRDGAPDVTLLSGTTGTLRRYTYSEDKWIGGSPPEITAYKAEPGSVLLAAMDLNGTGAAEIIISPPPAGGAQDLIFYELGTPPIKYPLSFNPYDLGTTDVDGDGSDDLMVLEKDSLNVVRYNASGDRYISHSIQGTGARGPVAAADFDGDSLAEIAVVANGTRVNFRQGDVSSEGDWTLRSHTWRSWELALLGPFTMGDFNGDGWTDVAGITEGDSLKLSLWTFGLADDGNTTLIDQGQIDLPAGTNALDVAACGNNVYALVGGGGTQVVYRAKVEGSGDWTATSQWAGGIEVQGTSLDCGVVKASTSGIAVAGVAGSWTTLDTSGSTVATGDVGAAGNIALADTDGDGVDEVVACTTTDCFITAGDLDNDGIDEIAASGAGTIVRGWGQRIDLPGSGEVTVANIDDNHRKDVIVYDSASEAIIIHRGMNGDVAPPAALATHRSLRGPVFVGDVDGDGTAELVSVDVDGDLVHTPASSVLEADAEAEEAGDTGG